MHVNYEMEAVNWRESLASYVTNGLQGVWLVEVGLFVIIILDNIKYLHCSLHRMAITKESIITVCNMQAIS